MTASRSGFICPKKSGDKFARRAEDLFSLFNFEITESKRPFQFFEIQIVSLWISKKIASSSRRLKRLRQNSWLSFKKITQILRRKNIEKTTSAIHLLFILKKNSSIANKNKVNASSQIDLTLELIHKHVRSLLLNNWKQKVSV